MRKVTIQAVQSFNNKETKTISSNTRVFHCKDTNTTKLFLHENLIAKKVNNELFVTNAGWQSNTTKERLNGLDGVNIYQKNWVWHLNEKSWNGDLIKID